MNTHSMVVGTRAESGLLRPLGWLGGGTVLRAVCGLAAEAVVLRHLGPAAWGEAVLALALFAIAQLARLQLGAAVQTHLACLPAAGGAGAARGLLRDAWALATASALLVAALLWLAAPVLAAAYAIPALGPMLRALALVSVAAQAVGPLDQPALLGLSDWRASFRQGAAEAVALPLAAVAVVAGDLGPLGWVVLLRAAPLAGAPLAWRRWRALAREAAVHDPSRRVPPARLVGFGAPMTVNHLLNQAAVQLPLLVAGARLPAEAVGLVGFALGTAARLWQLAAGPEKLFLSRISAARGQGAEAESRALEDAWRSMLALAALLGLPLAALPGIAARLLGGAAFAPAALALALAALHLPLAAPAVLRFALYAALRPWATTGLLLARLGVTALACLALPLPAGPLAGLALVPAAGWLVAGLACLVRGYRAGALPAESVRSGIRAALLAHAGVAALLLAAALLPFGVGESLLARGAAGLALLAVAMPAGLALALGGARAAALLTDGVAALRARAA